MENATKALLIAAAVLIVIVLIALGVALLNSGSDVTGQARSVSESTSVQTFNAQFSAYLGERQTAASVRSLDIAVKASNKSNADQVTLTGATNPVDGHFYKVVADYTGEGGRIKSITVTDVNTTTSGT